MEAAWLNKGGQDHRKARVHMEEEEEEEVEESAKMLRRHHLR